jgi:hypothetical protein
LPSGGSTLPAASPMVTAWRYSRPKQDRRIEIRFVEIVPLQKHLAGIHSSLNERSAGLFMLRERNA